MSSLRIRPPVPLTGSTTATVTHTTCFPSATCCTASAISMTASGSASFLRSPTTVEDRDRLDDVCHWRERGAGQLRLELQHVPAAHLLHWYPTVTPGTYTGQAQAGWSLTGNADYIAIGGEFPRVNGATSRGSSGLPARSGDEQAWHRDPRPHSGRQLGLCEFGTRHLDCAWDMDNEILRYDGFAMEAPPPSDQSRASPTSPTDPRWSSSTRVSPPGRHTLIASKLWTRLTTRGQGCLGPGDDLRHCTLRLRQPDP